MNIQVNGQPQELPDAASVSDLLEKIGLGHKRVAVERNGELVPKSLHSRQQLADGDRIEIVQAIGGG